MISVLTAAAIGAAEQAPKRIGQGGIGDGAVLEMVGALLLVLTVIIALAWLLRGVQRLGGQWREDLRIIGQIPLGSRERAVVVQVGEEQFLLGVGPGQVRFLCRLENPLQGSSKSQGASLSFAKVLEKMRAAPSANEGER
jgi:flagellar protein FliO/FliZ